MRSREGYLIFGAYPASGAAAAEGELARVSRETRGTALDAAEAYRMWGGRFFPVAPARPTPAPGRVLVPASRVGAVLDHLMDSPAELAALGSVARDGSALLLVFAGYGEGRPRSLSAGDEAALVGIARGVGGDLYHMVLKQRAERAPPEVPHFTLAHEHTCVSRHINQADDQTVPNGLRPSMRSTC